MKPLSLREPHPSRTNLKENRDLILLIDKYTLILTLQNQRMVEIVSVVDECVARARASHDSISIPGG